MTKSTDSLSWLCRFGFHKWHEPRENVRICQCCNQEQHLFMVMKCRGAFQVMSGFGDLIKEWRKV